MKAMDILENETEVLEFLKSQYPMYHLSNVFFRDVQYGIQTFLERRGIKANYKESEKVSREYVSRLVKKQILKPIDAQSWVLNYEAFRKAPVKPAAPAKPAPAAKAAGPAPAAARPAGGLPPLKSATPAAARPAGGLPPLKSSAPAGAPKPTQPPAPAAEPRQQVDAKPPEAPKEKVEVQATPAAEPAKSAAPQTKRALPPIKSSKPVGG